LNAACVIANAFINSFEENGFLSVHLMMNLDIILNSKNVLLYFPYILLKQ